MASRGRSDALAWSTHLRLQPFDEDMATHNKQDLLNFIGDLVIPIGPYVFAGFGSDIQKRLAQDPTCMDDLIEHYLSQVNLSELEPILCEVASGMGIPESYQSLRNRFQHDWDYVMTTLIYEAFGQDEIQFWQIITQLEQSECAAQIVADLKLWKEESS